MEPHANVSCILKVDVRCDACKIKVVDVLSSIHGVYSVTISAEEKTANICGEVDPNILLRALARAGRHAELVWVNLKHPRLSRSSYTSANDSHYYGHSYGALEDPYYSRSYRSRALPDTSYYDTYSQSYYPTTSYFNPASSYTYTTPPARYVPSYPPQEYDPYADESFSLCTIM